MNKYVILLVYIEMCLSLNCYSCSGTTACDDPFDSVGSGVSTTDNPSDTYCIVSYYFC